MSDSPRRIFRVTESDDGRTLGDFLVRRCPEAPVGFLNRLIRQGFARVSREPADRKRRLRAGERVALRLPPGSFLVAPNPNVPLEIVYEDDALVVLNKAAGVVSEPGIGHKLDTVLNGLVARYGEAQDRLGPARDFGMAHRLDRDTSGLLVAARTAAVQRALAGQFRRREVEKRYLALAVGRVADDRGEIRLPLRRVRRRGRAIAVAGGPGAAFATTAFRILERFPDATFLEAPPRTGRWRQVRVHLAATGHPVAGDRDEGDTPENSALCRRIGLQRMFLHAARLRFRHPVTDRTMQMEAPLPRPLQEALETLRRQALAS